MASGIVVIVCHFYSIVVVVDVLDINRGSSRRVFFTVLYYSYQRRNINDNNEWWLILYPS